jgi:hypothetical protein
MTKKELKLQNELLKAQTLLAESEANVQRLTARLHHMTQSHYQLQQTLQQAAGVLKAYEVEHGEDIPF